MMNTKDDFMINTKDDLKLRFLTAVQTKLPYKDKAKLVNAVMDILNIEREAAYRRIRGEVPFTFLEVATISSQIGLSLDAVCNVSSPPIYLFHSDTINCTNPEDAAGFMKASLQFFKSHQDGVHSEMIEAVNTIPIALYWKYNQISKLYLLKYLYLSGGFNNVEALSNHSLIDDVKKTQREYALKVEEIKEVCYIIDPSFMKHLVNDILYFYHIRLISKAEVELLKSELLDLLNDMEALSTEGLYNTTKNKIRVYIPKIDITTSYGCVEIDDMYMSRITLFASNQMVSFDTTTCKMLKRWLYSLLKTSTEISVSGEIQRILFFEKQREIIKDLYHLE